MDLFRVGAYSGEGTYLSVYTYSREIWYEDFKLLAKRNITGLYHKHAWEVELQSNFQACQQNPGMASVIGDLIFSCIGTMYTSRSSGNVTVFNSVSCI